MTATLDEGTKTELVDALEGLEEALDNVRNLVETSALGRMLRSGGDMPYNLRNFLADLQGSEGGWLMPENDSFREQVATLRTLVATSETLDDEETV